MTSRKDETIASMYSTIKEEKTIKEQDETIKEQEKTIKEQEKTIKEVLDIFGTKDEAIVFMDNTTKYQVEIINKQEKTIEELRERVGVLYDAVLAQANENRTLRAKLEEFERYSRLKILKPSNNETTAHPISKEEEVSFKPIDLLLDPENKSQMDMMDDTKTRNVIKSEAGEEIELDDELLEYLLKCGIIQKSGTPESTERKIESPVDVLNEMKAYLKEERANRNKPNGQPNGQPKTNMARMVDLLRRL